jgi:hypothetical protein
LLAINKHLYWCGLRAFNYVLHPPFFIAFAGHSIGLI